MNKPNTYTAIQMDLKKLERHIARRQKWCTLEAKAGHSAAARMYEEDFRELMDILNLISAGDYKGAWNLIDLLDTAVRDDIPVRLYNFIAKENGYN